MNLEILANAGKTLQYGGRAEQLVNVHRHTHKVRPEIDLSNYAKALSSGTEIWRQGLGLELAYLMNLDFLCPASCPCVCIWCAFLVLPPVEFSLGSTFLVPGNLGSTDVKPVLEDILICLCHGSYISLSYLSRMAVSPSIN